MSRSNSALTLAKAFLVLAGLGILAILAWLTGPWLHIVWFDLFYMNPTFLVSLVLCIVIFVAITMLEINQGSEGPGFFAWGSLVVAGIGFVIYGFLADGIAKSKLAESVSPVALEALPDTTEVRYLPMAVAEKFGRNKVQDPKHKLGDLDPLDMGGELDWVAPRVPNGWWNALTDRTDGFIIVKPDGSVETVHQEMTCGEGMAITDDIYWALLSTNYWVEIPEVYYLRLNTEEVVGMAPYIEYRYQFPVRVPTWGGVFVIHPNCVIEDLTPVAAMADPRFTGQRLFPEKLAKQIAESWAYRRGIGNAWFVHEDQTEVPTIAGEVNQMPYLLPTANGPMWFIGMEPSGPSYSIYKIMFIDAHTGAVNLYEVPAESGMVSPNKAAGYVRSAFPNYQWYTTSDDGKQSAGTILALEPKPIIRGGRLYWQLSVTNTDYADISRTALVDGQTTGVVYFNSLVEIQQFLAGQFAGYDAATDATETVTTTQPQSDVQAFLKTLTVEQLLQLQEDIINELRARGVR